MLEKLMGELTQGGTSTSVCTDPGVVTLFETYLLACSAKSFASLLPAGSPLMSTVKFRDRLGWNSVVEGRLCKVWLHPGELLIEHHGLRRTAESWGQGVIRYSLAHSHPLSVVLSQHCRPL